MNDIELGLLLNFIFWIVALPAVVFIATLACVIFFDAMENAQENTRAGSSRDAFPRPSLVSKEEDEEYRKSA